MLETQVPSLGREDPLEKEMATHSSVLAWRIPGWGSLVGCRPQGRTPLKHLSSSSSAVYSLVIMIINLNAVISYQLIFKCLPSVLPTATKQNCFYFPTVYLESLHMPGIVKRVGITYYMG